MSVIGIVGGSGLYELEGLTDKKWQRVDSPFGRPSDDLLVGKLGEHEVVFLPRHGRGHKIPPHEIPYAANIDALKRAGVQQVISVSAVGSLRDDRPPGDFVVVDQFIDRTLRKPKTFFSTGLTAHVSVGHPTCRRMMKSLFSTGKQLGLPIHEGGTYVVMEGPQFSTMAESQLHRSWGADVIGMTNMPEAKLAREAELCYASVAMVTDFDCWHPAHDHVDVAQVVKVMQANGANVKKLLATVIPVVAQHEGECQFGCDRALEHAIMTAPGSADLELVKKLDAVAGRVLGRFT
ncbi:MAG: S-methyl-5'-thioadenosine phosphorylase [Deltaproteobacteria bacterium]